jgi:hypothetical protein
LYWALSPIAPQVILSIQHLSCSHLAIAAVPSIDFSVLVEVILRSELFEDN